MKSDRRSNKREKKYFGYNSYEESDIFRADTPNHYIEQADALIKEQEAKDAIEQEKILARQNTPPRTRRAPREPRPQPVRRTAPRRRLYLPFDWPMVIGFIVLAWIFYFIIYQCVRRPDPITVPLFMAYVPVMVACIGYMLSFRGFHIICPALLCCSGMGLRLLVKLMTDLWGVSRGDQLLFILIGLAFSFIEAIAVFGALAIMLEEQVSVFELVSYGLSYLMVIYLGPLIDSAYKNYGIQEFTMHCVITMMVMTGIYTLYHIITARNR